MVIFGCLLVNFGQGSRSQDGMSDSIYLAILAFIPVLAGAVLVSGLVVGIRSKQESPRFPRSLAACPLTPRTRFRVSGKRDSVLR